MKVILTALMALAMLPFGAHAQALARTLFDGMNLQYLGGYQISTGAGTTDAGTIRVTANVADGADQTLGSMSDQCLTPYLTCSVEGRLADIDAQLRAMNSTNPQPTVQTPATTGGTLVYSFIAAAGTNAVLIKATAGQFYGLHCHNHAAYEVSLRTFDTSTTPVPGTSTIKERFSVPAGQDIDVNRPLGTAYAAGLGIDATKLIVDSDTTALVASDLTCNVDYF